MTTWHTEADLHIDWRDVVGRLMDLHPEKIILFGSFARGEGTVYSDVDLFVVRQTDEPFFDRADAVYDRLDIHLPLDILVWTPEEVAQALASGNALVSSIMQTGRVLYDSSGPDAGVAAVA